MRKSVGLLAFFAAAAALSAATLGANGARADDQLCTMRVITTSTDGDGRPTESSYSAPTTCHAGDPPGTVYQSVDTPVTHYNSFAGDGNPDVTYTNPNYTTTYQGVPPKTTTPGGTTSPKRTPATVSRTK
jgi:hypothetical protein